MSDLAEKRGPNAWGDKQVAEWFARQTIKRSYQDDVVARLKALPSDKFDLQQYGALSVNPERYPLYRVTSKNWDPKKPTVLITGGVHGYEKSGITGALRFLEEVAPQYAGKVNFVVYPCVSPFAYEIDHRWNAKAIDPNRNFLEGTAVEESGLLMQSIKRVKKELLQNKRFRFAVDLHETNNRDIELRKEKAQRDDSPAGESDEIIPNGFYLCVTRLWDVWVGKKIVEAVGKETPICSDKKIIGYKNHGGVIVINDVPGLMQGFASKHARMAVTTEIYPDQVPLRESENAQIAAIKRAVELSLK